MKLNKVSIWLSLICLVSLFSWLVTKYYVKLSRQHIELVKEGKSINEPQTTRVHYGSVSGINESIEFYTEYGDYFENDNINLNPNDNHNVHNITIVDTVKEKLSILYQTYDLTLTFSSIVNQIKQLILEHQDDYPTINTTLDFIIRSRAKYSPKLIKESEIIKLIWSRIHHPINQNNQTKLIKEFMFQLNDCLQEDNTVCCLEGRIVRYFQTLELHDSQSDIWSLVPLWAFKNEIQTHCANSLNLMITGMSSNNQLIYFKSNPTTNEQNLIDQWNQKLINQLQTEFTTQYQDKIEPKILNQLTKPCFEAISG